MSTVTSPSEAPAETETGPRTARLEILERHKGPDRHGQNYPLAPNLLRVNGRPLLATQDDPIVVNEIRVDGRPGSPLVVVLRFLARSLALGVDAQIEGVDTEAKVIGNHAAVISVPGLSGEPGEAAVPYVIVDGMRLLLGGPVVTHQMGLGDGLDVLVVDVPLMCRSVVFDDEVADPA